MATRKENVAARKAARLAGESFQTTGKGVISNVKSAAQSLASKISPRRSTPGDSGISGTPGQRTIPIEDQIKVEGGRNFGTIPDMDEINPLLNPGFQLQGAGNPVFKTEAQLDEAERILKERPGDVPEQFRGITKDQFDAARASLRAGGRGVDPLGFRSEALRDSEGNIVDSQGRPIGSLIGKDNLSTAQGVQDFEDRTTRAPADAPLQDLRSGAMGKPGKLGATQIFEKKLADLNEEERISLQNLTESFKGRGIDDSVVQHEVNKRTAAFREKRNALIEGQKIKIQEAEAREFMKETPTQKDGITPNNTGMSSIDFSIPNEGGTQNNVQIQSLLSQAQTDPIFAPYAGILQGLLTQQSSTNADAIFTSQLLQFQAEDLDRSGVSDDVEQVAANSQRLIQQRAAKLDAINQENKSIALEAARIRKEMAEFQKAEFELGQKAREQEQIEANIESEIKNRRLANRLGIESGTNGLKLLRDEVRKGREALQRLQEFGDIQEAKFALATGAQYNLDVRAALNNYEAQQALIDTNFENQLAEVNSMVSADAKERKAMRSKIYADYWAAKDKEDEKAAEELKDKREAMRDMISDNRDSRNDALDRLESVFENFAPGSSMRKFALDNARIAGVDVSEININDEIINTSNAKEKASAALWDITPYLEDPEKLALINSASAVSNLAVRTQVDNQYKRFKTMIDQGKHEEALQDMKNFASSKMSAGMKKANAARNAIIIKSGELLSSLDKIKDSDVAENFFAAFGEVGEEMNRRADKAGGYDSLSSSDFNWYNRELQNLRNKFGMNKNPELQEVFAKVQNIASSIIKERYGSAVTDNELRLAKAFIAMPGDTLEDMKIKISEFARFSAEENRQELGTQGIPADLFMPGLTTDLPIMLQSKVVPTDDELLDMQRQIEEDLESIGEVSYTGRSTVSKEYDGRRVELARPVLLAFDKANEDFKSDHGMDIRVAAVDTATTRDQAKTIKMMAREAGIEFDENNPNNTAQKLRDSGKQVADVGFSKHEIGEAIDLYPFDIHINGRQYTGSEYIALVKPYLERYGIKQVNHRGRDPGNFEFQTT